MSDKKIRIAITHGDINGVGTETILRLAQDDRLLELCTPVIYGSRRAFDFYRKSLGINDAQYKFISDASQAADGQFNIVDVVGGDIEITPGQSTPEAGRAAFAALERAVADLKEGEVDLMVTAPINKHNIQSEEFRFPGHTEYLEASLGDGDKALMILCNDTTRVALVTTHCPIAEVSSHITRENILEKLRLFSHSLTCDFGLHHPRIAVLALNPHAGDSGVIGTEETDTIIPAIEEARREKINCFGPYPADGFFGSDQHTHFDGILAMYHDQGLAPFKTLAMENGVNFTAGLPYVRTSPDHGTAYDIAGRGEASEASLRAAIYTAIDIYRNRGRHHEATRNPLRRQYFDKSKDNVVLDLTKDA